ncbi:MAG: GMP synthase (glutamine-hydrolyzing) [Bacteroidetes bacterium HGW-Bacteroidetes-6]|jgi:GMP synthase (glutamine-hydrolysing)|nr:MAG: GMP synthase (glutamine-hydrolyzing) [Bacteroidetes bacterium HGW-Bacteroidetes-6]
MSPLDKILILDFGSQYTQLIARRIRELNVFCEIKPYTYEPDSNEGIAGIVLSGSPFSVRDINAPFPKIDHMRKHIPILGVCYGAQYLASVAGGEVYPSESREYGRANLVSIDSNEPLFSGIKAGTQVWMSHGDTIMAAPDSFKVICSTTDVTIAGYRVEGEPTYGIQFHPEVYHSTDGSKLLSNFLNICNCQRNWTPESFVQSTVEELKTTLGNDRVIMGLSGGVDSTVAATLIHMAIGERLHGIFIDNGLLRKNEFEQVLEIYRSIGLNVTGVRAGDRFLGNMAGVSDPEQKRKIIGKTFIDIFEEEALQIEGAAWLGQGTIYPDVIESISVNGPSQTIKSHHNVGGLPDKMKLKIVEPLRLLFKDEVRRVGAALQIPDNLLQRHPFPGPGLGIRVLGEVTPEKVRVLQEADDIFIGKLLETGLYKEVWQAFAVLLPVNTVGVMGDERTYENVLAIRAVTSVDGMTADWAHLPHEFLSSVSSEIINKVRGINRVVYDISSKPPATIEWE